MWSSDRPDVHGQLRLVLGLFFVGVEGVMRSGFGSKIVTGAAFLAATVIAFPLIAIGSVMVWIEDWASWRPVSGSSASEAEKCQARTLMGQAGSGVSRHGEDC